MMSSTLKSTAGLSRAVLHINSSRFRKTIIPLRSLTSLTMGFDEIAAWKARRLAIPTTHTNPTSSPPTTTTLHSSITHPAIPTFPRHEPSPRNTNERSASEIHDVPSLDILGRLHAGARPAPTPAPTPVPTPAPASSDKKTVVPKSTLANGLETLRRLSDLIGRGKKGGGGSTSSAVPAPAPMAGGVPLKGGVATTNNGEEKPVYSERRFPRELPMFLGGGLY